MAGNAEVSRALLQRCRGRQYDAAFERLQRQALKLVRCHSSAIQRVAAALTVRQTLTAAEVRAVIDTRQDRDSRSTMLRNAMSAVVRAR